MKHHDVAIPAWMAWTGRSQGGRGGEDLTADRFDLVARNVWRFRHERGYSLSELARRAGLAKQTLSSLEAGQANPTVLTLATIATALGIPVAHLLTEYGSPVLIKRSQDATWSEGADGTVRELDQIYGFGFVRTSLIRHVRTVDGPLEHQAHVQSETAALYMVTTVPRVSQVGPR